MALVDSKSFLANTIAGYGTADTSNPFGVYYPYRYPPLDAVLDSAPPASFASGATALGAALTVLAAQLESRSQRCADCHMATSTRVRRHTAC